ncbi:MAG: O-antigen ligase family protein [Sphingomonadales bacterium]|nr:O-antigen ligase family protein [Sphingomonadales bacterium]
MTAHRLNVGPAMRGYSSDILVRSGLFVAIFLVYSSAMPFATVAFGIPTTPAYVAIILIASALCSGLFLVRPTLPASKFIIAMLGVYLGLILVQAVFVPLATQDILKSRIMWAVVTAAAIVVLQNARERDLVWSMRLVVGFSVLVLLLEYGSRFSLPVKMSTVVGRAAGLYMNPNIAAFFLCAAMPLVTLRATVVVRLFWYIIIGVATQLTFSRGGMLLWASMLVVVEAFSPTASRSKSHGLRLLILVIFAVAIYASYAFVVQNAQSILASSLDSNTSNRLRFGVNDSSKIRIYIIQRAIEAAQSSIIFGRGIGYAYSWDEGLSVHNMFVLVLLEQGIVGLIWFAALFFAIFSVRAPFGIWLAAVMVVTGMFNHNLFDSPTYGLVIALYAALPSVSWDSA